MIQQTHLSTLNAAEAYQEVLVPALFVPAVHILLQHAKPQPGERVLDVACGTGIVSREVAPLVGAQGKVTAVDVSPAMLAVARSLPQPEGARIEWREGNVLALQFPDQTFDLALCQQGLQFFPDRLAALREMRRVLVPDGRVVVSTQQSLESNPVYQELNQALVRHLGVPALEVPFALGDASQLERLLSDAGFREVEVFAVSHPVRFPSAEVFIEASVLGSAAAVTALAGMDAATRAVLVEQLNQEMNNTLARFVENGALVISMAAIIGHARA